MVEADAIRRATLLLQEDRPGPEVLAVLEPVGPAHPRFASAQHLRAVCAFRAGDAVQATALLVDAVDRGEGGGLAALNLARMALAADRLDDAWPALLRLIQGEGAGRRLRLAYEVLKIVGFTEPGPHPRKETVFRRLLVPLTAWMLDQREMNNAIQLEAIIYDFHVKALETEAHFSACMSTLEPLYTRAAHAWRARLPPVPQVRLDPPWKVGFFIHGASTLAHIEVLLNTLKGYRRLDDQPFEAIVYCFSGENELMEKALADIGVRLVMLHKLYPDAESSPWVRLLKFRQLLAAEGVQELVWVSLVLMMPLAFGLRLAPVQAWLAMKYRNYSQPDIDGYVTGSALTRFGTMGGRRWRMGMLGVDDWYDPAQEPKAARMREQVAGRTVLMTLARTEKMHDPAYLTATAQILKAHPQAIFVWAGRAESPIVVEAFRQAGVLDRTQFVGWVDTRLYAQVADVFLDTFPFPCGFTLYQAMAAGKPVVTCDTAEAAQTGLWAFLKPVLEDGEGTPEERAELESFLGPAEAPLISIARTPEAYVGLAGRLIEDAEARRAAGAASAGFIRRYFSDPTVLGASLARHFVELLELRRAEESAPRPLAT